VQECKADLGCGEKDDDLDDAEFWARVRHRRGQKRTFIDITNSEEVQVRIAFHKRRRDGSGPVRAREALRLLTVAGEEASDANLRALGFGGKAAATAMAAGPLELEEECSYLPLDRGRWQKDACNC
jgi:hypothetical protein